MKKIIYTVIFFSTLIIYSGCEKSEMLRYGDGNEINFMGDFYGGKDSHRPYWTDEEKYMKYEMNFGLNSRGDSLLIDTVSVGVKIMGIPADHPRKVVFKIKAPEENALEVMFPQEYYVPADTGRAEFKILLKRPEKRNTVHTAELTFDYEQSDFQAGTRERQYFKLKAENTVTLELWGSDPEEWEGYYSMFFGDYSETKARWLITRYGAVSLTDWTAEDAFLDLLYMNAFYTDFEEYRADPSNPPLIDENTGEWISIPDISELL